MRTGRPLTFSKDQIQQILDLANYGIRVVDIAKTIGRKPSAIYGLMDRMKIPRQPRNKFPQGDANISWKGGRHIDADGYILVRAVYHPFANAQGYVREHRLVMEKHIGRYLDQNEVVHHIDCNKQNNEVTNLQLYGTNGDHLRDEMTGKKLKMTEDGLRRKRESARRHRKKKQASIQTE